MELKTPGRISIRGRGSDDDDTTPYSEEQRFGLEILESLSPEPYEVSDTTEEMIPVWVATMYSNWGKIRSNFEQLGQAVGQSRARYTLALGKVEKEFESVLRKVALLDTRLGINTSSNGTASVWEALEGVTSEGNTLSERVLFLEGQVKNLTDELANEKEARELLARRVDVISDTLGNLGDSYSRNLKTIGTKLGALERKAPRSVGFDAGGGARDPGVTANELFGLERRVESKLETLQQASVQLRHGLEELRAENVLRTAEVESG